MDGRDRDLTQVRVDILSAPGDRSSRLLPYAEAASCGFDGFTLRHSESA